MMNRYNSADKDGRRSRTSGTTGPKPVEGEKVATTASCGNDGIRGSPIASTSKTPNVSAAAGPSNASKPRKPGFRTFGSKATLDVFGFGSRPKSSSGTQPTRPAGKLKTKAPPPPNAEVIELTESDDEAKKPRKPKSTILPSPPRSRKLKSMSFVDLTETPSDNDANSDPPPVRRGTGRKSKGKHTKSPTTSWDTLVGNSENPISISDSDDEGQAEVAKAKGKGKEVEDIKQDTKAAGPSHSKSPGTSTSVAKATSVDIAPSPPSSTAPSPVNEAFADDEEDYGMDVDQPVHSPMDAPSLHDAEAAPLFEPHEKSRSPAPTNDLGTSGEKTSVSGGMVVDRPSPGLSPEHPRVVAMSPPQTPITENVILPASPQHVQDTLHTPLQHGFSSLHRITPSPKLAPSTSFSSTPTSSQRPLPLPIPRSFSGSPTKPSRSESSFASPGASQMGAPALSFPRSPSTLPHHRRSSDDINMRGLESALDESTQSSPTGMAGPSTGSPNPRSLLSSLPRGLPNSPTNSVRNRPISGLPKPRKDILSRRDSVTSVRSNTSRFSLPESSSLVDAFNKIHQSTGSSQPIVTPKSASSSGAPTPAASALQPGSLADIITQAGHNNHVTPRPSKRRLSQTDFEDDHHIPSKGKGKGKEKAVVSPLLGGYTSEKKRGSSSGSSIPTRKYKPSQTASGSASDASESTPDTSASLHDQEHPISPIDEAPPYELKGIVQTTATSIINTSQETVRNETVTTELSCQKTLSADGSSSVLFSSTPTLAAPFYDEKDVDDVHQQADVEMEDVMDEQELEAQLIPELLPITPGPETDNEYSGIPDAQSEGTSNAYARSSGRSSRSPLASDDQSTFPRYQSHESTPDDPDRPLERFFGGYKAMSWRSYRANLANFPPKHSLAKNLPHSLQDLINSMDESSRRLLGMRHVFEAAILENTSADEPEAPPIQVINDVDDDPAPPWEFHYSNQMWHTDDVPAPDMQNLVSCKCIGKCDPKKGNCACAERQKQQANGTILDFAYDRNRRLKAFEYPIFECNELCACGDDCRNRVVQHGRMVTVNITKTVDKGWGVFAGNKRIPTGTFIGIYAGELITDAEGEERGIKYDQSGRTYLFDLDFHHLKSGNPNWTTKYVVDAYHAGNFTRFLNHSCDPNCSLYPCYVNEANIDKPHLAIFALRDIEPFEEICFSYWGNPNDSDGDNDGDEENPLDIVHSRCKCGASNCTGRVFK